MEIKKQMTKTVVWTILLTVITTSAHAQKGNVTPDRVGSIQFCDKKFNYQSDSITLCLNILDVDGNRCKNLPQAALDEYLSIFADNQDRAIETGIITSVMSGQRIPDDMTFSLLIDLNIPEDGKKEIREVVRQLVEGAPDSSVYLSFFGDRVTATKMVTRGNLDDFNSMFSASATRKYFYSALYAKLTEFSNQQAEKSDMLQALETDYRQDPVLTRRAEANKGKNFFFIITDSETPAMDEDIMFLDVTDYHRNSPNNMPKVFAFYYTGGKNISEDDLKLKTLISVTGKSEGAEGIDAARRGEYHDCNDIGSIIDGMKAAIDEQSYDYLFTYKVDEDDTYAGKTIHYIAKYGGKQTKGEVEYTIGTKERPWPERVETAAGTAIKYLIALLVTALTIAFFFLVMKVVVPMVKSKRFSLKYYKKYEPEPGISRRICSFCKNDIRPGDPVVTKCLNDPKCGHLIHVHCWQQNRYRCPEYGQKCNDGIQQHVEWSEVFTWRSVRDCQLTIAGIIAGLLSWVIYEMMGRGGFGALATPIVKTFFTNQEQMTNHFGTCVTKVSAFLAIGLLLGFFLSLIFRYSDEYRQKNWKIYLKIIGLSFLSALVGMAAFALGGGIFCMILSVINTTNVPWYCSLPAYLLFSVCMPLSLTIKSTIPMKSALIGGLISAVIGFIVLYFADMASGKWSWMNMLLNFIIYGGGLGASLVTVRMLAERYWLIIKNGVKSGQRIPIHKWMNAAGGSNKVTIGMTIGCEIMMNWEKSNKVAKEHVQLYINHERNVPVIKPLATGVNYNMRAELPVNREQILSSGDLFRIGDTIFQYTETE